MSIKAQPKKLTPKRERFCREYSVDYNGTQAAIRSGYSKHSAKEIASELLTIPNVKARIEALQAKVAEKLNITTEYLTNELIENHNLARKSKKLNDSNRAIELIGKLHGKFVEKIETKDTTFMDFLKQTYGDKTDNEEKTR